MNVIGSILCVSLDRPFKNRLYSPNHSSIEVPFSVVTCRPSVSSASLSFMGSEKNTIEMLVELPVEFSLQKKGNKSRPTCFFFCI
uniref:Uncharacterized protein n=1 Tax=Pyxicephalus adspersus TaxID=30357 RepID=A0AAV2ZL61_PYXAD|nr:TPA: hypothetical protein GDO54_002470 [Pyxicephalus adspersus]